MIRPEEQRDYSAVYAVNSAAFGRAAEADLVEILRTQAHPYISLVAEEQAEIVGHALFTPVTLTGHEDLKIMGLGPVAVMPAHQRTGFGSQLIKTGLDRCRELGYGACVVLGHAHYYPRFGFIPSVNFGIGSEYRVPPEVFMVTELVKDYLDGKKGIIRYHPAFAGV